MIRSELYKRSNYINTDIVTIKNSYIYEYDIHDAGFSLIKKYKLLDDDTIEYLSKLDKLDRHIYVGKLQRKDKKFSKNLMDCFTLAREQFYDENDLEDNDILSNKKDAIFVINKKLIHTKFGDYIQFNKKNRYSTYVRANKIEYYYDIWNDKLDVKGTELNDVMRDELKHLFRIYNRTQSDGVFYEYLCEFTSKYIKQEFPMEMYRECDSDKLFTINDDSSYNRYKVDVPMDNLDIRYNYMKIILPLVNVLI